MTNAVGLVTWRRAVEWAAIVAGFIAVRFVGRPATWPGWLALILASILVATPVILAAHREFQREREAATASDLAARYRARLGVTLGDTIIPIADLLGRINAARGEERGRLTAQAMQGTVDAVAALCDSERARATFLLLDGTLLKPAAWAGRTDPPPLTLAPGSAVRRMRELTAHHGRLLVSDVSRDLPPSWLRDESGPQSLAVNVVSCAGRPLGLLIADSPEPGDLTEDDLDVVATLGQLLGAALMHAPSARRPASASSA